VSACASRWAAKPEFLKLRRSDGRGNAEAQECSGGPIADPRVAVLEERDQAESPYPLIMPGRDLDSGRPHGPVGVVERLLDEAAHFGRVSRGQNQQSGGAVGKVGVADERSEGCEAVVGEFLKSRGDGCLKESATVLLPAI
jgi:hypothetical protein